VIAFLMKIDHLSFTETIERLADRMGYQLRYEQGNFTPAPAGNRSRLIAANALAAKFYQEQLNTSPLAAHARELMTKRGFDKGACETFGVGYAPDEWDGLTKFLREQGFTIDELETAGLSKMGQRGPIDKFRNRLTWPIKDISGDVVGFGARKLASDEEDQGPKYLNTSETPIYKKSQVLYGLDMAKKEIAKKRQVVIVEGYTDVMAAQLAGITTAVATCGTAFGADHIRIIRRLLMDDDAFRGEVIFTFDGDAAGQKAAMRAFTEDQKFVTQTFVAVEPNGLDPCDLRQQKGDLALRDLIAKRVPLFEFAIRTELALHKLDTAEGRVNALNATAPLVAQIRDKSLRPEYTRLLAGWLGVEVETVSSAVAQGVKKQPQQSAPAAIEEDAPQVQWRPNPQEPRLILEREVLKARLQMPSLISNWREIESGAFSHPAYIQLAQIIAQADEKSSIEIEQIADENMRSLFTELNVEPIRADGEVTGHYVESIVARLREVGISRAIAELKSSLQRLNPVENEQEYNQAFASLVALETTRRGLHDLALRSI
jgi:DNA primase